MKSLPRICDIFVLVAKKQRSLGIISEQVKDVGIAELPNDLEKIIMNGLMIERNLKWT
jgi:hypothetical protein